jgi:hypothetical protein
MPSIFCFTIIWDPTITSTKLISHLVSILSGVNPSSQ